MAAVSVVSCVCVEGVMLLLATLCPATVQLRLVAGLVQCAWLWDDTTRHYNSKQASNLAGNKKILVVGWRFVG